MNTTGPNHVGWMITFSGSRVNGDIPPSRTSTTTFALRLIANTLPGTDSENEALFDSDDDGVADTRAT